MQPEEIAGDSPHADQGGNQPSEGRGADGVSPPPVVAEWPTPETEATGTAGPEADGADEDFGGGEEDHLDQEDSGGDGSEVPETKRKDRRISGQTFRAACVAAKGNRALVAAATGLNRKTVTRRINADPELKEKYGDHDADAPDTPPGEMGVLNRNAGDLPEHVSIEIGKATDSDLELYRTALRVYGVSEERLQKIKTLDGLSTNWPAHVAISLRGHHQSYDGQLHNLAEVADGIKKKLDKADKLDAEDHSYLAKVHVECVKEIGKGVGMMLQLTEALIRLNKSSQPDPNGGKATSGWGPMKKVRPA